MNREQVEALLTEFCELLEHEADLGLSQRGLTNIDVPRFGYDYGYKYARIWSEHTIDYAGKYTQRLAQFRVDVKTGDIYGVKSWTQVNTRRWYGDRSQCNAATRHRVRIPAR